MWLNHQIISKLLGPAAWVWLVWGAAATPCATALPNSLLSVTDLWDGVTPAIPIWEKAVARWCLPASPDSSSCFYGMKGDGVMPVWRRDEPIEGHGITVLTVSEIQVYSAIISETQRQHSWLQRSRTTTSRFLQHWHEEMHSDSPWTEQDSLFHSQISGRLHWRGCCGEVILAGFLRSRIKDGISA